VLAPAGMRFFGYHDPLPANGDEHDIDWAVFWNAVRLSVASRCDHALVPLVHASFAAGSRSEPSGEASPVLSLAACADLDAVLARCSSSHRRDIRRQLRRLADTVGRLNLWVAAPAAAAQVAADFHDRFVPAYRRVWSNSRGGVMFDRPGVHAFVTRVLADGIPGGWGQYAVLRAGERDIAWHLGFEYRGACYWWIPAYDIGLREFSPGRLMVALMIEHCIQQGVTSLHFLTGDHHYKREWRPDDSDLRTIRWHAPSIRGMALAWYDSARRLVN